MEEVPKNRVIETTTVTAFMYEIGDVRLQFQLEHKDKGRQFKTFVEILEQAKKDVEERGKQIKK